MPHDSRAFTLLEVTVTLGLVALIAALALPRLVGRGASSLEGAAGDAARRLTTARWHAIVEGHAVIVALDDLAPGLHVASDDGTALDHGSPALAFAPIPAAVPRQVVLSDATGAMARITIPPGLAPLAVTYEDPS